jgi:hypothetical protein
MSNHTVQNGFRNILIYISGELKDQLLAPRPAFVHHCANNIDTNLLSRHQQKLQADIYKLRCLFNLAIVEGRVNSRAVTTIYNCKWLKAYLGINASLIISSDQPRSNLRIIFRWPLRWAVVLTGRMRMFGLSPTVPVISLRRQNIIPQCSLIIHACKNNDISTMRELFATNHAHANDTTLENLTLLRVCCSLLTTEN